MSDLAKKIISDALFNFREGAESDKRGKQPWGRERSDWRADAILEALDAAGVCFINRDSYEWPMKPST